MPCALPIRSEEHTSELQSPCNLVCRLLLEKKNVHMLTGFSFENRARRPIAQCLVRPFIVLNFFLNNTPTTEIYPLSLHDALPLWMATATKTPSSFFSPRSTGTSTSFRQPSRSEEHTSELQSPCNLVCRLLLE